MKELHDALKKLITEFGVGIFGNIQKCKAYLADYTANEYADEIKALAILFENRIADEILEKKNINEQDIQNFLPRINGAEITDKTIDIKKVVTTFCKALDELGLIELSEDTVIRDLISAAKQDLEALQYEKVISDMANAINLYPNEESFYVIQGTAYHRLEDYDKAIASYTSAIRLNPNESFYYVIRSLLYCFRGVSTLAIEDYKKSIAIDPDNIYLYCIASILYPRIYDYKYDDAISDLYKALQRLSNNNLIIRGEEVSDDGKNGLNDTLSKVIETVNAFKANKNSFRMERKTGQFYGTWDDFLQYDGAVYKPLNDVLNGFINTFEILLLSSYDGVTDER
jgi:tetratricopeptide (TPR) repeat protein